MPATHILGTGRFVVIIEGKCSGMEGLALITGFMLVWFFAERCTLRLLRALILVPMALALMWVLNLFRLVVLISIGNAGHPNLAINGFHAQAGWITFNVAALTFLLVAQRIAWFHKGNVAAVQGLPVVESKTFINPSAVYLLPFIMVLATSLLSKALSGSVDLLYPLRLLAVISVFLFFRDVFATLDWHFAWTGIFAGVSVGAFWVAAHYVLSKETAHAVSSPSPSGLAALPSSHRTLWITCRVITAVCAVPVAEELAFRGFLARRFLSPVFEAVSYRALTSASIALSSIAFGLMHGRMWAPGILAGLVFAWVAKRSGRLGEAVAAHASANLCVAGVALVTGNYTLWS